MNALKRIFTVFISVAMATSTSFAYSNYCDYDTYRNLHKQECEKHNKKTAQSDSTLLAVLGGAALAILVHTVPQITILIQQFNVQPTSA